MYQRLIAFGCSFTNGQCLPDQDYHPTKKNPMIKPSKFSWPSVAANMLSIPFVNNGICGAGNKQIAYNALEFDYQPNDIVVVMWSSPFRHCEIRQKNKVTQLAATGRSMHEKFLFGKSNDFDLFTTNAMYQHLIDLHVKSLGLKIIHTEMCDFKEIWPDWLTSNRVLPFYNYKKDYAADGAHYGVNSHKKYAKALVKYIRVA